MELHIVDKIHDCTHDRHTAAQLLPQDDMSHNYAHPSLTIVRESVVSYANRIAQSLQNPGRLRHQELWQCSVRANPLSDTTLCPHLDTKRTKAKILIPIFKSAKT